MTESGPFCESSSEPPTYGAAETRPRDGLIPKRPQHGRRDADRAAAVGAVRERQHAGGDRRRGAARRAAGRARRVPRVAARAVQLGLGDAVIPNSGVFDLAEHDEAGVLHPPHDRRVVRRDVVGERARRERRAHAGRLRQVLDQHRHARERPGRRRAIARACSKTVGDKEVQLGVRRLDPRDRRSTSSRGETSPARTCAARASASVTSDSLARDVPDGALRADVLRVAQRRAARSTVPRISLGVAALEAAAGHLGRDAVAGLPRARGSEARRGFRHGAGSSGYKARTRARRSRSRGAQLAEQIAPVGRAGPRERCLQESASSVSTRVGARGGGRCCRRAVSVAPIRASSSRASSRGERRRGRSRCRRGRLSKRRVVGSARNGWAGPSSGGRAVGGFAARAARAADRPCDQPVGQLGSERFPLSGEAHGAKRTLPALWRRSRRSAP